MYVGNDGVEVEFFGFVFGFFGNYVLFLYVY